MLLNSGSCKAVICTLVSLFVSVLGHIFILLLRIERYTMRTCLAKQGGASSVS